MFRRWRREGQTSSSDDGAGLNDRRVDRRKGGGVSCVCRRRSRRGNSGEVDEGQWEERRVRAGPLTSSAGGGVRSVDDSGFRCIAELASSFSVDRKPENAPARAVAREDVSTGARSAVRRDEPVAMAAACVPLPFPSLMSFRDPLRSLPGSGAAKIVLERRAEMRKSEDFMVGEGALSVVEVKKVDRPAVER